MERVPKGCLMIVIAFAIMAIGIYIGLIYDWFYLKNLCMMLFSTVVVYIGNYYFQHDEKKRTPKRYWKWFFLAAFVLAGILTWIEYNYFD